MFNESIAAAVAWFAFSEGMGPGMGKVLEEDCGTGCRVTAFPVGRGDRDGLDYPDVRDACCRGLCCHEGCDAAIVSPALLRLWS